MSAAKVLISELQHAKKTKTGSLQTRFQDQTDSSAQTIEMEKIMKKRIIELSLNYSILTPYTTLGGVEKRSNGNNIDMALREVPIQISADDQHLISSNSLNSVLTTTLTLLTIASTIPTTTSYVVTTTPVNYFISPSNSEPTEDVELLDVLALTTDTSCLESSSSSLYFSYAHWITLFACFFFFTIW